MQDESERRQRLGEHVAPAGLYAAVKARPFLGSVACSHDRLVAGSWHEIVLTYEVGACGIADGATFKATFKFCSDWALFQTADPSAGSLRLPNWNLETVPRPDPLDPLHVGRPAIASERRRDPALPVAPVLESQGDDGGSQCGLVFDHHGALALCRAALT
ncbi:hypothetical protein BK022_24845 [Methylorubrum extorquens]|uniref:Uncharacterized protein n=1 Tax=Methylorubrum extorquens TaxID=408 RepID=A0A1S1P062_METEX|nr:hypothetical protein BK022_24845 [Methylorubrum extorquens]